MPEWTHDIDWGTAPAWAAVLVGAIVGAFSVTGILLARRNYRDNVWQTKVATARLVYCDVRRRAIADDGETVPNLGMGNVDRPFGGYYMTELRTNGDGYEAQFVKASIAAFHVVVTNHSDEPIGDAYLSVIDPDTGVPVSTEHPMRLGTLAPKSSADCAVYVPRTWTKRPTTEARVQLSFRDSAGTEWRRIETSPPSEVRVPLVSSKPSSLLPSL